MSDILDLDALSPEVKKIKISGKIIDCYPPKLIQLIDMQKILMQIEAGNMKPEEAITRIKRVLTPIVPAMKKDKSIDFNMLQLSALLKFVTQSAISSSAVKEAGTAVEKKINSAEQSPTSSELTPATP